MGYAELIERVQTLPADKQAEVFDFVEFLAARNAAGELPMPTLAQSSLAELMRNPIVVTDFKPMSRDEANAPTCTIQLA